MLSKALQDKLDFYEQAYYSLDDPVPFKKELKVYPVLVKDYYTFYNCLSCLTMDKTVKTVVENGKTIKIPNPEGIAQSYMAYLITTMQDIKIGPLVTAQVMQLFELVFHIPRGIYCPHCGKQLTYDEAFGGLKNFVQEKVNESNKLFAEAVKKREEETGEKAEVNKIPDELMDKIKRSAEFEYYKQALTCSECGEEMRDVFSIKTQGALKRLMVKEVEITDDEFDELKALIPRQNILDYDGDKYMDPDLKEELEIKARLQNQDYTSPTLEKQLTCVAVGTGFTFEYLKTITMRKLSMLLRTVDRKGTYYAQLQASMSGMVTFKEGSIKHWIFSDDKKNIAQELTSLEAFEKKFERVT